ncbi:MAG: clostripain-related cysteine peptidase [Candidatus Heimdallarchaeota archaeon]
MFKNHLISQKSIKSNSLLIFSLVIILSLNSSFLLQSNTTVSVESDIQPVLEPNDVVFDWLIMIYLDGDNNLEEYAIDDINEMEAGKITGSSIAVIVMVDRISGYDTTNGDWTDTRIYNITSDGSTSTINSVILEYEGEANMGDGAVLESFLDYCFTNFDANNYWLNLWDHGGGTDGICWDDTDSSDFLTIDEMQTAIQNSVTTHSRDIDLITHDACFMNMLEVAYELKDLADYFVASEESIPADGFDYETIISDLEANPTMNATVLSEIIVDSYESFYDSIYTDVTLSTINLTLFDTFVPYLNYFALNLTEVLNDGIGRVIDDHFFNSQMFYDDFVLDFVHFIEEILANNTLMTNYPDLNQSAINLITQLNSLIVDNYQGSAYSENANGVTIFMPYSNSIYDLYIDDYIASLDIFTDMDWQTDTLWDEFLANFYIR